MKKHFIFLFIALYIIPLHAARVGLLIVATGQYINFVQPLINSAQKHFCPNHEIFYLVFTDGTLPPQDHVLVLPHKKLGWPHDTLMRCTVYYQHRELMKELELDYVFATDADMLFVDTVGDEILSDRVGTLHPGYFGKFGTYETRSSSLAYVNPREAKFYFAGGFHGGNLSEFIKLVQTMTEKIYTDLEHNIIAVWHDESHLNRYFIDNPPTKILTPDYCFPGDMSKAKQWGIAKFSPKLVALEKDHASIRK